MNNITSEQINNQNIPKESKPQSRKSALIILIATAITLIALDQITKSLVSASLQMYRPVNIIGNYLRFILIHNEGLIWGLPFKNNVSYYILPIIGIIVIIYIAVKTKSRFLGLTYGLILAGATGNLIDRIRFGYVVDFIDMGIKNLRWPTYNIADMSIIFGIILVFIYEIFGRKKTNA